MIEAAEPGTRHHRRLKAARLLGGYVAGGLLTEDQAYGALAETLVGRTNDLERALKTVEDGLAYGQAHPITLEALEAERRSWLEAHRHLSHNGQTRPSHSPAKEQDHGQRNGTLSTVDVPQVAGGGLRTVDAQEVATWRR
jgi:hypothetical protein